MLEKSFNYLIPFDEDDLIRLGIEKDGGYVISKKSLEKSHFLLSFGMSNEWSFEEDFIKQDSRNLVNIYDHTVGLSDLFLGFYKSIKRIFYFKSNFKNIFNKTKDLLKYLKIQKSKIKHFKNKISNDKLLSSKSLGESILESNYPGKMILKIDIEGDEFEVLKDINLYSEKIHTLIVEFHTLDINLNEFEKLIKDIQKKYYIIHIHGNNHTGCKNEFPNTLEVTLLNIKDFFNDNKQTKLKFPIDKLDFRNHQFKKDLAINFQK